MSTSYWQKDCFESLTEDDLMQYRRTYHKCYEELLEARKNPSKTTEPPEEPVALAPKQGENEKKKKINKNKKKNMKKTIRAKNTNKETKRRDKDEAEPKQETSVTTLKTSHSNEEATPPETKSAPSTRLLLT